MGVARLVVVPLLLCIACTGTPVAVPRTAPPSDGASTSAAPISPRLRLQLSSPSMDAGSCVTGTVSASSGGPVAAPRVEVVGSRTGTIAVDTSGPGGAVRICAGWTGAAPVLLRAVAAGFIPSSAVALRVRPERWMLQVERLTGTARMSVSVGGGAATTIYSHRGDVERPPASNEKLLLSMALLDRFGPGYRIATEVRGAPIRAGTVAGDLWLVGDGDPELGSAGLARLASRLRSAGVGRIKGSIVGVTGTFRRDRTAPGWRKIALRYIGLPTALTFRRNASPSGFVFDPELRAAVALTADLRARGIRVEGRPRAAAGPPEGGVLARVDSALLVDILRRQNVASLNLSAEVLDKMLGAAVEGPPGSIAEGAAAIQSWATSHGVAVVAHDASGLSYADRITTDGMVAVLTEAASEPWGVALRGTLPGPGEGTLDRRLGGVRVRAKTGTLFNGVSALSGWVWAERSRRWMEFSILSQGLRKSRAISLEDGVVRILAGV